MITTIKFKMNKVLIRRIIHFIYIVLVICTTSCLPLQLYIAKKPENIIVSGNRFNGSVYFTGYQVYNGDINKNFRLKKNEEENILFALITAIPLELREKINMAEIDKKVFYAEEARPFSRIVSYTYYPFDNFIPVYDDSRPLNDTSSLYYICLKHLNERNKADYYMSLTEYIKKNNSKEIELSLILSVYNRYGQKVYSKEYNQNYDKSDDLSKDKNYFYNYTMSMIKDVSNQIVKDIQIIFNISCGGKSTIEALYRKINIPR